MRTHLVLIVCCLAGAGGYAQAIPEAANLQTGTALVYSTYLGGNQGGDAVLDLAVDANGNAVATGYSSASDFPAILGAFQRTGGGGNGRDAFVAKMKPAGSAPVSFPCGVVFDDVNGNGVRDAGEPGLPGWTIQVSGPTSASTATDSQGHYCFTDLPAGAYTLSEVLPAGWNRVSPAAGTYAVTVSAQNPPGSFDFGNCPQAPFWTWAASSHGSREDVVEGSVLEK